MDDFTKYIRAQADKPTAWIGAFGLLLQFLGFSSALFLLFIALIVLPEAHFSDISKKLAAWVKSWENKQ